MLVHRERSFVNSAAILAYIDDACGEGHLYPRDSALKHEVQELEQYFDHKLGPHVRRWAYFHLLNERNVLVRVRSEGGRTYLVGDRFSAADLTFASLAAPLLLPPECRAALPTLDMVPAKMKDQVTGFRGNSRREVRNAPVPAGT